MKTRVRQRRMLNNLIIWMKIRMPTQIETEIMISRKMPMDRD